MINPFSRKQRMKVPPELRDKISASSTRRSRKTDLPDTLWAFYFVVMWAVFMTWFSYLLMVE